MAAGGGSAGQRRGGACACIARYLGDHGYRYDTNAFVAALSRLAATLFLQLCYDEAKETYAAVDAAVRSWSAQRSVGSRTSWARIFSHYYTGEAEKEIAFAREAYERSKVVREERHYDTVFARATAAAGLVIAECHLPCMPNLAEALQLGKANEKTVKGSASPAIASLPLPPIG